MALYLTSRKATLNDCNECFKRCGTSQRPALLNLKLKASIGHIPVSARLGKKLSEKFHVFWSAFLGHKLIVPTYIKFIIPELASRKSLRASVSKAASIFFHNHINLNPRPFGFNNPFISVFFFLATLLSLYKVEFVEPLVHYLMNLTPFLATILMLTSSIVKFL